MYVFDHAYCLVLSPLFILSVFVSCAQCSCLFAVVVVSLRFKRKNCLVFQIFQLMFESCCSISFFCAAQLSRYRATSSLSPPKLEYDNPQLKHIPPSVHIMMPSSWLIALAASGWRMLSAIVCIHQSISKIDWVPVVCAGLSSPLVLWGFSSIRKLGKEE